MRIRRKKWAERELNEAKFYIDNPEEGYKNTWETHFAKKQPIHIEIGCGKGLFISTLAKSKYKLYSNRYDRSNAWSFKKKYRGSL